MAAVLADDAHGVVEAQAEALAGWLGGEEGLEDAVLQFGRNAGAGIQISTSIISPSRRQVRRSRP